MPLPFVLLLLVIAVLVTAIMGTGSGSARPAPRVTCGAREGHRVCTNDPHPPGTAHHDRVLSNRYHSVTWR